MTQPDYLGETPHSDDCGINRLWDGGDECTCDRPQRAVEAAIAGTRAEIAAWLRNDLTKMNPGKALFQYIADAIERGDTK